MQADYSRSVRVMVLSISTALFACYNETVQKTEDHAKALGQNLLTRSAGKELRESEQQSLDDTESPDLVDPESEDEATDSESAASDIAQTATATATATDEASIAMSRPDPIADGLREGETSEAGIGANKKPAGEPMPLPDPKAGESLPTEDRLRDMIKAGKLMTTVLISKDNPILDREATAKAWFSSKDKPIPLYVAVEDGGSIPPLGIIRQRQIASGTVEKPSEAVFSELLAPLTALHSSLRVCNKSGSSIHLGADRASPFSNGLAPIGDGLCAQFIVERAQFSFGSLYDRIAGREYPIYLKIIKVSREGKILP